MDALVRLELEEDLAEQLAYARLVDDKAEVAALEALLARVQEEDV